MGSLLSVFTGAMDNATELTTHFIGNQPEQTVQVSLQSSSSSSPSSLLRDGQVAE